MNRFGGARNNHRMDIEQIKALTELMVANDLTEIMLRDGENRVVIRRQAPGSTGSVPPAAQAVQTVLAATHATHVARPIETAAAAVTEVNGQLIKSPMVGTFYATPDPDAPPFVSVGSRVEPDTVVCIIEAMKVFNEIKADVSGIVERVLVNNGQPVEYGQPLFQVSAR